MNFVALKVREDNFMYLFYDHDSAIAFDPYDKKIIEKALACDFTKKIYEEHELEISREKRSLRAVFVTHSHFDHNRDASLFKNIPVYSGKNLNDSQMIENVLCIYTPCHTLDSYCFKIGNYLVTGDTFFYLGVGKFFEGNGRMMENSIEKLLKLNEDIILLYGHDYSKTNLAFAEQFFPIPESIKGKIFLTIREEKQYNPFIRWMDIKNMGKARNIDDIRRMKDIFKID
ncbi:putative hydroxyacylglutathione hydrolase [Dictyocoela muelleri]|nr:putative hydroxyacylglutathione hydrolase [Dictyocoela muelleri]